MVLRMWDYRMVTRNGSAFCLPPMRGVRRAVPWRWDWAASAWITDEGSSGTLVSWVDNAYACVVIASV